MIKQVLRTALATAMALSFAVMPALTVCAEEVTEPIYIRREDKNVEGDLDITLEQSGSSLGYAVHVSNGSLIVSGDVTIDDPNNAIRGTGIRTSIGSDVEIEGDYTVNGGGENPIAAATSSDGSIIAVSGFVNSNSDGISVTSSGNVFVGKDLNAKSNGLNLTVDKDSNRSNVVICGTLNTEEGPAINLKGIYYHTPEGIAGIIPNVAVYEIKSPDNVDMITTNDFIGGSVAIKEVKEAFEKSINYIIHTGGGDVELSGAGLKRAEDFGVDDPDIKFTTARIGEAFYAYVADNYEITGNDRVSVNYVGPGQYSITLTDKRGGIVLTAAAIIPDPVPEPEPGTDPGPNPQPQPQQVVFIINDGSSGSGAEISRSDSSYNPESYSYIPLDAVNVSVPRTSASAALAGAGPSVLGANRTPSRTVTFKMSRLTDAQYKETVIKNINATPSGGLLRIETDKVACFDRAMLEAFAKKGNVDMEVLFPVGGKKISVMIPMGIDINELLDEKGYAGFLRLLAIIGGE